MFGILSDPIIIPGRHESIDIFIRELTPQRTAFSWRRSSISTLYFFRKTSYHSVVPRAFFIIQLYNAISTSPRVRVCACALVDEWRHYPVDYPKQDADVTTKSFLKKKNTQSFGIISRRKRKNVACCKKKLPYEENYIALLYFPSFPINLFVLYFSYAFDVKYCHFIAIIFGPNNPKLYLLLNAEITSFCLITQIHVVYKDYAFCGFSPCPDLF